MEPDNEELSETLSEIDRQAADLPEWFVREIEKSVLPLLAPTFKDLGRFRLVGDACGLSLFPESFLSRYTHDEVASPVTCVWLNRLPTVLPTTPEIVEFVQEFREEHPAAVGSVVAFVPYITERSVARALLLKAIDEEPDAAVHLVCMQGVRNEIELVVSEIALMTGTTPIKHVSTYRETAPSQGWPLELEPLILSLDVDADEFIPPICYPAIRDLYEYNLSQDASIQHQRKRAAEFGNAPRFDV